MLDNKTYYFENMVCRPRPKVMLESQKLVAGCNDPNGRELWEETMVLSGKMPGILQYR